MSENGEVIEKFSEVKQVPKFQPSPVTKRPCSVTLLAYLVLIFTGFHLIRVFRALQLWDFLAVLPGVPAFYLALTGVLWTISGLLLLWLLWKGHTRAPVITLGLAVLYSLCFWIDRLFIANTKSGLPNLAFLAAANAFLLAFALWASLNPKSKRYFERQLTLTDQSESMY
jgi:hypothetical protein